MDIPRALLKNTAADLTSPETLFRISSLCSKDRIQRSKTEDDTCSIEQIYSSQFWIQEEDATRGQDGIFHPSMVGQNAKQVYAAISNYEESMKVLVGGVLVVTQRVVERRDVDELEDEMATQRQGCQRKL
jgi:hypothetical protein